jgi:hypothetical protein
MTVYKADSRIAKKLEALQAYMDDQEISIDWDGSHMVVSDNESGKRGIIRDLDDKSNISNLPYLCEVVIEVFL